MERDNGEEQDRKQEAASGNSNQQADDLTGTETMAEGMERSRDLRAMKEAEWMEIRT